MSTTTTRRCVGSARFGIEAHEAPISAFPRQPSQPDGLGCMCREHWQAYAAGLRRDALARKATPGSAMPSPKAAEVERAEALISEVDAMPAGEMVQRVGNADVQAALEVSAASRMPAD